MPESRREPGPQSQHDDLSDLKDELQPICNALRRQKVIPWVGSGLSAGLPSWAAFLDGLVSKLKSAPEKTNPRESPPKKDYLALASWLKDRLDDATWSNAIQRTYETTAPPPEVYRLLARLRVPHMITTNFDPWLKNAVAGQYKKAPHVCDPGTENVRAFVEEGPPTVFMIHGDASNPAQCVLTRDQYDIVEHAKPALRTAISALITCHRILFLGYSFSDPDTEAFFANWKVVLRPKSETQHFFLGAGIKEEDRKRLFDRGIEPIDYGAHDRLPAILRWLAEESAPRTEREQDQPRLLRRCNDIGLVDAAIVTGREGTDPELVAQTIPDLIDGLAENGELFLVARSLENWLLHFEQLGTTIARRNLKCTIVFPDPGRPIRSLVLNDPSQTFNEQLWRNVQTALRESFLKACEDRRSTGCLKIYGIPAYVPATFSLLTTTSKDKTVRRCMLEVGIGMPPGKPRVQIVFQSLPDDDGAVSRLKDIYEGILRERKPLLSLPEDNLERCTSQSAKLKDINPSVNSDPDIYTDKGAHWGGEAICLTTAPLGQYHCGEGFARALGEIRSGLAQIAQQTLADIDLAEDWHIPIYYPKRSYHWNVDLTDSEHRLFQNVHRWVENGRSFTLRFDRLHVDAAGWIRLLGVSDPENAFDALQEGLDILMEGSDARFAPKRPSEPAILLGRLITLPAVTNARAVLMSAVRDRTLDSPLQLEIDHLRLMLEHYEGNLPKLRRFPQNAPQDAPVYSTLYLMREAPWRRLVAEIPQPPNPIPEQDPAVQDTKKAQGPDWRKLVAKTVESPDPLRQLHLHVLSPSKWLGNEELVKAVKMGAKFDHMLPLTVQIAPTLDCTSNCLVCSYGKIKPRFRDTNERSMSSQTMTTCLQQLKGSGCSVIFTGGGEPLCNDKVTLAGMREAKECGLGVGLFTNGQKLYRAVAEQLVEIEPDFVRISINAGSERAYKALHRPKEGFSLKGVLENVRGLAEEKRRTGSKLNIHIGVLITPVLLDNFFELACAIKRIALEFPGALHSVAVRPAVAYEGGNWNTDGSDAEQCVRESPLTEVRCFSDLYSHGATKAQFPSELFELALSIVKNEIQPILNAPDASGRGLDVAMPERRIRDLTSRADDPNRVLRCSAAPIAAFIGPDSSVYYCVERAFEEEACLGRLADPKTGASSGTSFRDLMRKRPEAMRRMSESSNGKCPPVCILHEHNEALADIGEKISAGADSKVRIQHEVEMARRYFTERMQPKLGHAAKYH